MLLNNKGNKTKLKIKSSDFFLLKNPAFKKSAIYEYRLNERIVEFFEISQVFNIRF